MSRSRLCGWPVSTSIRSCALTRHHSSERLVREIGAAPRRSEASRSGQWDEYAASRCSWCQKRNGREGRRSRSYLCPSPSDESPRTPETGVQLQRIPAASDADTTILRYARLTLTLATCQNGCIPGGARRQEVHS